MPRRVHFCFSREAARIYAGAQGGKLLSGEQHPDANHKAIRGFIDREHDLLVADWTMFTGWRVEGDDIAITFDEDVGIYEREKAEGRVKRLKSLL